MYIRLFPSSVHMEQLGWHWTDYYEIWYLNIFLKPVEKIQESLKHGKKRALYMKNNTHFWIIFASVLLRMKNVSD